MKYKPILKIIGGALLAEAALMCLALFCAFIYREEMTSIAISIALSIAIGLLLLYLGRTSEDLTEKESFMSTALTWIVLSLVGMSPFLLSGVIISPVDAFFETVSGFTTTGATTLTDVEIVPKSILLWRSSLHWIGGMGILVFMSAIMYFAGGSQIKLVKAESTGPIVSKLVPKASSTARILYIMYTFLTIVTVIALLLSGLPFYDSLCLAFSSAGTGGFSILNDSCASYTTLQQAILSVACAAFGVSFNIYFLIFIGRWKTALKNEELRTYLGLLLGFTILTFVNLLINGTYEERSPLMVLHSAAFNTISVMTTTGFAIDDVNIWPGFSQLLMLVIMVCGSCAGSTGGGIKISRIVIMIKSFLREMQVHLRPGLIKKIHVDGKPLDEIVVRRTNTYCFAFTLITIISILFVALNNKGWMESISSVFACFNNVGPGIGENGTMGNYANFSVLSKLVLSADMLIGRLEIYPVLALFSRNSWRKF